MYAHMSLKVHSRTHETVMEPCILFMIETTDKS